MMTCLLVLMPAILVARILFSSIRRNACQFPGIAFDGSTRLLTPFSLLLPPFLSCIILPMFHAFTGCDTVSSFGGRGKRTAWDTWKAYKDVTPAFCALVAMPIPQTIEEWLGPLERFVVLLYDCTSSQERANEARKHLFTQKGREIDGLPPTQDALIQHIKRATYQAGHCWAQITL